MIRVLVYNSVMIPADVREFLDQNDLEAIEFEEGSTPTAETAAEKIGVKTGQIAKSILLKGKNRSFYLIVCAGDRKIDSKKVKALTGTQVRMARAQELSDVLGFRPGEVCPFRKTAATLYIDSSLSRYDTIYPAAGTDSSGVPVTYNKLIEITGAETCDVTA